MIAGRTKIQYLFLNSTIGLRPTTIENSNNDQ